MTVCAMHDQAYHHGMTHDYRILLTHHPPLGHDAGCPHVSLQDQSVSGARAEGVAIPGQGPHPGAVTLQRVHLLVGSHVPHLTLGSIMVTIEL